MLRNALLLARFVLPAIGVAAFFAPAVHADEPKEESAASDKTSAEKDKPAASGIWDTAEDPTKPYRYVGARYRHVIVPQFVLNLFTEGGALTHVPVAGLEFGTRRDHLEYIFSLSYADYATGDLLIRGSGQPAFSNELVNSDLGVIFGKVEILYEIPLDKKSRFALLIGGGVGIGGVIGDLYRAQAYPKQLNADPTDPTQWGRCTASGQPDIAYCSNDNQAFGKYAEPSWASGGSKPFVFPWIAVPQVSFRYKPLKFLQARVDAGLALTSGFYFGGSIDYVL
jgi:hypothetical protein